MITPLKKALTNRDFLCFGAVFALLSLGTAGIEITRIDVRFALMVEEISRYGLKVFPTVNGVEYADYPSTYFLFSYLTTLGGRWINLWSLALPSLLLGAFSAVVTMRIGESIQKGVGAFAVALLVLSMEYLNLFVGFGIDIPVVACGVVLLRVLQTSSGTWKALAVFGGLLIAAFFIRGPLGLLMVGAGGAGYLLGTRQWKAIFSYGVVGVATSLLCAAAGYGLIIYTGGEQLWHVFLDWQIGSRIEGGKVLYYFTNAIGSYAPVTLFAVVTIVMFRRELLRSPLAGILGYLLLPMILLSIPGTKHLRYMALTIPAFALVGSWGIVNARGRLQVFYEKLFRICGALVVPVAVIIVAVLAIVGCRYLPAAHLPWGHWGVGVAALVLLIPVSGKWPPLLRTAVAAGIFFMAAVIPFQIASENSHTFVSRVESIREGKVYLFRIGSDHDDLKYIWNTAPERRSGIVYVFRELPLPSPQLGRMYPGIVVEEAIPLVMEQDVVLLWPRNLEALRKAAADAGRSVEVLFSGEMGHREFLVAKLLPEEQ